jgi:hypothetical protein
MKAYKLRIISSSTPIPVAARSKRGSADRSLAGSAGSNGYLSLVSLASCQVEVSATNRSLVQTSLTKCVNVNECDQVQQ